MTDDLSAKLAALDEEFADAPVDDDPYALPEPGTYQAILRRIDSFDSKAGDFFLKLVYEIALDAKYEGREVDMLYNMTNTDVDGDMRRKRLGFLKKDLTTLGFDTDAEDFSLGQLYPGSSVWEQVLDVPVELAIVDSKKTNPTTGRPYRNVYLNARMGDPLESDVTPVQPVLSHGQVEGDDDDLPF